MEFMYCPKCGALNKENANFCVKCGLSISGAGSSNNSAGEEYQKKIISTNLINGIKNNSILLLILGWMSAATSLFFIPIVFGLIGLSFGFAERKVNSTQGNILIIGSIICGVFGIIFGAIVGAGY